MPTRLWHRYTSVLLLVSDKNSDLILQPGHFTRIPDANNLNLKFASYYNFFASTERVDQPFLTPPYIDYSGLG